MWFRHQLIFLSFLPINVNIVVSPLYGRTFAVWTSVTCCLCVITAFNLDDQPIFLATLLSFFAALLHFVTEVFVYKTMTFSNSLSPLIVSSELTPRVLFNFINYRQTFSSYDTNHFVCTLGISIVWMLVQWPSHKKME